MPLNLRDATVINIWGEAHGGMVSIYIEDGIGIEERP
jgi:hypothetical protein